MRVKVRLDTMSDINSFVNIASKINSRVTLEDADGHVVSGKSLLGALYTMEWDSVYCVCDKDITMQIMPYLL